MIASLPNAGKGLRDAAHRLWPITDLLMKS